MASLKIRSHSVSYSIERVKDIILRTNALPIMILNAIIDRINADKYEKHKSEFYKMRSYDNKDEAQIDYLENVEESTRQAEMVINGEYDDNLKGGEENKLDLFDELFEFYIPRRMVYWLLDTDNKFNTNPINEALIDEYFRLEDNQNEKTKEDK